MTLTFPFDFTVRKGAGVLRASTTVQAANGRLARVLAAELVFRLHGALPSWLRMGAPR